MSCITDPAQYGPFDEAAFRRFIAAEPTELLPTSLQLLVDKELLPGDLDTLVESVASKIWVYAKGGLANRVDSIRLAAGSYRWFSRLLPDEFFRKMYDKVPIDERPAHALQLALGAHCTAATAYVLFAEMALQSEECQKTIQLVDRPLYRLYRWLRDDYARVPPPIAEITELVAITVRVLRQQIRPQEFLTYLAKHERSRPLTTAALEELFGDHINIQFGTSTVAADFFTYWLFSINDDIAKERVLRALKEHGNLYLASILRREWRPSGAALHLSNALLQMSLQRMLATGAYATDFLQVARYWIMTPDPLPIDNENLTEALQRCKKLYGALKADTKPEENMSDWALMQQAIAITYVYSTRTGSLNWKHHTMAGIELPRTFHLRRSRKSWITDILHQGKGIPRGYRVRANGKMRVLTETVSHGGTAKMSWVTRVSDSASTSEPVVFPFARLKRNDQLLFEERGIDLEKLRSKGISEAELATLMAGLGRALEHYWGWQRVHRDLKPENLLLMRDGTVRIIDEEMACSLGQAALLCGTHAYISPEQFEARFRGERLVAQHAMDVFAIGSTLIVMDGGALPWSADAARFLEAYKKGEHPLPPVDPIREGIATYRLELQSTIEQLPATARFKRALYELALACIHPEPRERPQTGDVCRRLQALP